MYNHLKVNTKYKRIKDGKIATILGVYPGSVEYRINGELMQLQKIMFVDLYEPLV